MRGAEHRARAHSFISPIAYGGPLIAHDSACTIYTRPKKANYSFNCYYFENKNLRFSSANQLRLNLKLSDCNHFPFAMFSCVCFHFSWLTKPPTPSKPPKMPQKKCVIVANWSNLEAGILGLQSTLMSICSARTCDCVWLSDSDWVIGSIYRWLCATLRIQSKCSINWKWFRLLMAWIALEWDSIDRRKLAVGAD